MRIFYVLVLSLLLSSCAPHLQKAIRYQFAGIEDYQIFASKVIAKGQSQAWTFADDYNEARLEPELLEAMENYDPVAFLVLQNGQIFYERYWQNHSPVSYSASFSMAKSILSLLIGIALEEGKLESLDQPVADFIPEFQEVPKNEITLRHLLLMTSGLDWDEAYTSPFSPTTELYYGENLYKQMTALDVKHPAGEVWYYSSADSQILGIALERAIGMSLSEYASEKLWKPLGAENDASWSLDRDNGTTKSNCCFNSTPRDFARLGQLVLQKGQWNGVQLVPASYVEEATRPYPGLEDENGNEVDFYAYQFWIGEFEGETFPYFRGILGQFIFVLPELNAVVIRLGDKDDPELKDAIIYQRVSRGLIKARN